MNIFNLRNKLISDYADYINSFIQIRDTRIDHYVEQEFMHKAVLWPEPLIQLNPQFERGASDRQVLSAQERTEARCPAFPGSPGEPVAGSAAHRALADVKPRPREARTP